MKRLALGGLALPALAALAVAGCPPKPAAPPAAALSPEATATVNGTIEQWRQAYEIRSMDALARLYSHDPGLAVVQDGARQLGWPATEEMLRGKLTRATQLRVSHGQTEFAFWVRFGLLFQIRQHLSRPRNLSHTHVSDGLISR